MKSILALLVACAVFAASAQEFPSRPVRIIVPSTPGGGYDFIGRVLADKLPQEFGQNVLVENRAGAGTLVGTQVAATATPDGYTLVIGGLANIAFNPTLYKDPRYDATHFTPVALVGSFSYLLTSRPDLPQASIRDVVSYAQKNPGKLTIAAAGQGTGQHVAGVLLARLAKVDLVTVQYKGAQAAYVDLLAGRVDLFFDNTTTALPFVKGGRVKPLVISSRARDALLPDVPTGKEAGIDGLELESWIGPFAPARTPKAVVERLRAAVGRVMQLPDVRARLEGNGCRVVTMAPKETEAYIRAEVGKWSSFLRQAGIRAE